MQNSTQWCMLWCLWQVCPTAEIKQIVECLCVLWWFVTSMAHQWVLLIYMSAAHHTWMQQKTDNSPGSSAHHRYMANQVPDYVPTAANKHTHLKNTYCCSNALQHQENHTHFIYRMTKWALRAVRISWKRTHSFSFDGQLEYIARRVCIKRMAHENANP